MRASLPFCIVGTGESSTDMVFSGHALIAQSGNILGESIFPAYTHRESRLILQIQANGLVTRVRATGECPVMRQ